MEATFSMWDGKKGKKKGGKGKGKGGKGGKGKKGKKGKKGGKGKKVVIIETPIIIDRPPTPPTIAYVNKLSFDNETDFFDYVIEEKFKQPTYVLFSFRESDYDRDEHLFDENELDEEKEIPEGEKSKIMEVEDWLQSCLFGMEQHHLSKDITFVVVRITPKQFKDCYAYHHPLVKLRELPTLMRWGSPIRLEGEECLSEKLLSLFLSREVQHNSASYVDDGSVCPFYSPPVPEPEPPPPPPTPPKKKPKKDKKGKKGKKDKKGKKGKGKKGKGKKGKGKKGKGKKK